MEIQYGATTKMMTVNLFIGICHKFKINTNQSILSNPHLKTTKLLKKPKFKSFSKLKMLCQLCQKKRYHASKMD